MSEVFDHLQGVVSYGDAGHFAGILSHHFRFFQADGKAKFFASMCRVLDEPLKSFLCVGGKSSVVSKEHLSEQDLTDFVLGSGMAEIEKLKIKTCEEMCSIY